MSRDSVVYRKSREFASRIMRLHSHLQKNGEKVVSAQIVRSGTSVGANIAEALYAASKKDFLCKVTIAQKECAETLYWLDLLSDNGYLDTDNARSITSDCDEILRMLVATTKSIKNPISYDEVRESIESYDPCFVNPLNPDGGAQ